jgi:hypothetical protein
LSSIEQEFTFENITLPNDDLHLKAFSSTRSEFSATILLKHNYPLSEPMVSFKLIDGSYESLYQEEHFYRASAFIGRPWTPSVTLVEIIEQLGY